MTGERPGGPILLEAQGVWKVYGRGRTETVALRDVSLQVGRGEAVALMGPSGSGKSTLLNILGLVLRPTRGSVLVMGEPAGDDETRRARLRNRVFGYIHQGLAILEDETVEANVAIPLEYARPRPSRRQRQGQVAAALERVGLGWARKRRVGELAGCGRQRVAIARALVHGPQVVLADEPTAFLDTETAAGIMDLLLAVKARGGSLVVATHDPRVARRCDRVVHLVDGAVVAGWAGLNPLTSPARGVRMPPTKERGNGNAREE